jgi:hypothetical protein
MEANLPVVASLSPKCTCSICGSSFKHDMALRMHSLRAHPKCFKCAICGASFKTAHMLGHHSRKDHTQSSTNLQKNDNDDIACTSNRKAFTDMDSSPSASEQLEASSGSADDVSIIDVVSPQMFKTPTTTGIKERCQYCLRLFVNLSNHKKCPRRSLNEVASSLQDTDEGISPANKNEPVVYNSDSDFSISSVRTRAQSRASSGVEHTSTESTSGNKAANPEGQLAAEHPVALDKSCQHGSRGQNVCEHHGCSRKGRIHSELLRELSELRKKCCTGVKEDVEDPLLKKLSQYHKCLSSEVCCFLTEKLSAEVLEVIVEESKVDDVTRPYVWTKDEELKLNQLNE